ncbi:MAG: acyl-CoA dehydrogenase family protein [Deltaproteobacteria bacterium]|nr:acyl-CoA dehydrogenase family protein [Deltaproteobacteria bacterium]MBW1737147.1 acyl-CoA dehydrogenase family protein [Deltaproteobacteria bacterium]MBW1909701.1 acyl-CoA dehydrogenase family protein [Deltaproteobacteria bacterium]MBW2034291.1 acyl-CoA dehydrogenase family protein [Deltaproteobacteria bacterium]MBW2114593.1 acyl-CoA dehydrogenase family protein [Deltaproteobacteria bacterium]
MDFDLTKEQRDIVKAAREFALGEFPDRAAEFDREETFDLGLWKKACDLGFVGIFIDEAYGGAGMGFLEYCLINEEFWAVDPGMSQAILSTTFGSELLGLFGSEDQRQQIFPQLVSGEAIMATAITEPDAGCDVTGAVTSAVKEGDKWLINGSKMFITNGDLAKYVLVFCMTDPENPSRHGRHSFILIPTDTPGYESTKIRGKLGIRASDTAELSFNNIRVPITNLVGKEGEGFYELMAFFNRTRLHICAQAVGLARGALEEAIRYTKNRRQFGEALASFQVTQFKIAEMATWIRASRNLYYQAAWSVDRGKIDHALIAMAKWFSAEMAVRCADEALQMHGGYGYIDEYKVQRLYRDAKILEIYEGTKEMEKTIVARSILG